KVPTPRCSDERTAPWLGALDPVRLVSATRLRSQPPRSRGKASVSGTWGAASSRTSLDEIATPPVTESSGWLDTLVRVPSPAGELPALAGTSPEATCHRTLRPIASSFGSALATGWARIPERCRTSPAPNTSALESYVSPGPAAFPTATFHSP